MQRNHAWLSREFLSIHPHALHFMLVCAALVQVPGQVPHVPGVRAMVAQRCGLGSSGVHAVSGHRPLRLT
jgi:hypothetical protein